MNKSFLAPGPHKNRCLSRFSPQAMVCEPWLRLIEIHLLKLGRALLHLKHREPQFLKEVGIWFIRKKGHIALVCLPVVFAIVGLPDGPRTIPSKSQFIQCLAFKVLT